MNAQALAKHEEIEQKNRKMKNLESTLNILGNELGIQQAMQEGRNFLALKKRISMRKDIEILCFSITQRKKNISRLAGLKLLRN